MKKNILSLEDIRELVQRASNIDGTLFDLRVAISRLMEGTKKEPTPLEIEMPIMMGGVNFPRIVVPKFGWHYTELAAVLGAVPSRRSQQATFGRY